MEGVVENEVTARAPASNPTDLAPLNIIRCETVFSKLPIHNLSKKGSVSIHIVKKNEQGEVELSWKVSPNRDFGEPRQLAYKLDTLIINRRIDEAGRPLPQLLKIGTHREVCRELGLSGSGYNIKHMKAAFHQDAGTYITAKIKYKGLDGSERTLEAGFTRYSVIFTGEKLPNGKKADAVYIELHPRYHEVLNHAPVRPLNYDYLKVLPPAPQRFYEIISYRIFTAIKYHQPTATLPYSEYCTFSAQQRYPDWEHVRKQMYKVHRSHLHSGYLQKVSYEATVDSQGNPDWLMHYVPGPKAEAEYNVFNPHKSKKGKESQPSAASRSQIKEPEGQPPEVKGKRREEGIAQDPAPSQKDPILTQAEELVGHFYRLFHHVKEAFPRSQEIDQALGLIANHGYDQARYVVEFSHRVAPETHYQPQTFGGILPYVARALADYDRKKQAEERREKERAEEHERERREQEARRRGEELLAALSPKEQAQVFAEAKEEFFARSPFSRLHPDSVIAKESIRAIVFEKLLRRAEKGTMQTGTEWPDPKTS